VGGGADDYEVSYGYEKATTGRNTLRRTSMSLPNGTATTFAYLSTGSLHDDVASRVTRVKIGDTILSGYQYNGIDSVVGTLYDEPDVMWKLSGSSGTYPDLDRFNRVVSSRWTKDLATDRDFYDTDIAWDRSSNVTSVDEQVHAGFDVLYTNDDLNRLKRAEEGTLSGGSISSRKRDQQWTLTQAGNWELDKVDLNGDGDFVDPNELNDDRTHNDVNELTARDTDDNGTNNYTLAYDAAGNLSDDGESYEYEWDAFYRLRKVKKTTDQSLVAEHKYSGLGYRISVHEDTDADGDVDANDKWFHSAFDERWRIVGTFRENDSGPKEQFVNHNAGLGGKGTGSNIDLVVLRDKDANTSWTSASDGTLEQRLFYCQNWQEDVVALVASGGAMLEWAKYSAYGVPFGLPGGDTDSDGDCDSTDVTQVQTWINASAYDVRGDIDLDGDVDATDKSTIETSYSGTVLGRGKLSAAAVRNSKGFVGYEHQAIGTALSRMENMAGVLGRWIERNAFEYADGPGLYVHGRPATIGLTVPTLGFGTGPAGSPWTKIKKTCYQTLKQTFSAPFGIIGYPTGVQWGMGQGKWVPNFTGESPSRCVQIVIPGLGQGWKCEIVTTPDWWEPGVTTKYKPVASCEQQASPQKQKQTNDFLCYWYGEPCGISTPVGAAALGVCGAAYTGIPLGLLKNEEVGIGKGWAVVPDPGSLCTQCPSVYDSFEPGSVWPRMRFDVPLSAVSKTNSKTITIDFLLNNTDITLQLEATFPCQ
jgi:hypothetical protein